MLESAVRLCEATRFIFRCDGELLRLVATHQRLAEYKEFVEQNPIRPGAATAPPATRFEGRTIHIPDVVADPEYTYRSRKAVGWRSDSSWRADAQGEMS